MAVWFQRTLKQWSKNVQEKLFYKGWHFIVNKSLEQTLEGLKEMSAVVVV